MELEALIEIFDSFLILVDIFEIETYIISHFDKIKKYR